MRYVLLTALILLPACQSSLPQLSSIVIEQRTSEIVPGSDDSLRLHVSDITGGEVYVRLSQDERNIVPLRVMSVGDSIVFELADRKQMLALSVMMNHLVGTDYAEFHIGEPNAVSRAQIDSMLDRISKSSSTFVLDHMDCDGKTMAARLRRNYETADGPIRNGEDFIEKIATCSFPGGAPYLVRVLPNKSTPLPIWIHGKR